MASATDIITYIGVPLAVLGVMPLLYNMYLAIKIRVILVYDVHSDIRSQVDFGMDYASGSVSVTSSPAYLDFKSLWRLHCPHDYVTSVKRSRSVPAWLNFVRVFLLIKDESSPLTPTWNPLLDMGHGLEIDTDRERREKHHILLYSARRQVIGSARSVEPPLLECSWPTFLYFALGLGVDAYSDGLANLRKSFDTGLPVSLELYSHVDKHSGPQAIFSLSTQGGRIIAELKTHKKDPSYQKGSAQQKNIVVFDCRRAMAYDYLYDVKPKGLESTGQSFASVTGIPRTQGDLNRFDASVPFDLSEVLKPVYFGLFFRDMGIDGDDARALERPLDRSVQPPRGLRSVLIWAMHLQNYAEDVRGSFLPSLQSMIWARYTLLMELEDTDDFQSALDSMLEEGTHQSIRDDVLAYLRINWENGDYREMRKFRAVFEQSSDSSAGRHLRHRQKPGPWMRSVATETMREIQQQVSRAFGLSDGRSKMDNIFSIPKPKKWSEKQRRIAKLFIIISPIGKSVRRRWELKMNEDGRSLRVDWPTNPLNDLLYGEVRDGSKGRTIYLT